MQGLDTIQYLIESLRYFQTEFNSSAYSTMGFTVVAGGWLMTSKSARAFVHAHYGLACVAIGLVALAFLGYAWMCLRIQELSQGIYDRLVAIPAAQGLFEHHRLTLPGAIAYIAFQGVASALVIVGLVAALRNPVTDGDD